MIILYTGFGISMSVFMMTGYIKSIPKDIEESAVIDGANIMQAFFYIMLPLIKPMTITIIILNGMWIWNDYLLPFLVLETSDFKTITLEIYYVKMTAGQYVSPWETLFPSVLIAILPLIVIFLSDIPAAINLCPQQLSIIQSLSALHSASFTAL